MCVCVCVCVCVRVCCMCVCVCVRVCVVCVYWAYRFDHFLINSSDQFSQQMEWVKVRCVDLTRGRNESDHNWQTGDTPAKDEGEDRWRGWERKRQAK